jgi:hypothetical protein
LKRLRISFLLARIDELASPTATAAATQNKKMNNEKLNDKTRKNKKK